MGVIIVFDPLSGFGLRMLLFGSREQLWFLSGFSALKDVNACAVDFMGGMCGKLTQYLLLATLILRVERRRENSLILTDFEVICGLAWLVQDFGW